jgi:hypothetical protein
MNRNYPSMPPGAIIGYLKNGKPVRIIAGGSEAATEAPAGDAPAAPTADAATPPAATTDPAPASAPETPAAPSEAANVDQLPPWAQKLIRDGRTEAATNRAKAKEHGDALEALKTQSQKQLDGIAQALGLKPEQATPEQIMAERDAARATADQSAAQARQSQVELAVFRAAAQSGANGTALLDSRSFVAGLDGLDPSSADFGQQVADKIAAATDANPAWKTAIPAPAVVPPPLAAPPAPPAAPVPARSGGEHTAPGGNRQWTLADVTAASKGNPQAVVDAINQGLLVDLGYAPTRNRR